MSYPPRSDGYDMRKWAANDTSGRRRRPFTRWAMLVINGLAIVAAAASTYADRLPVLIGLLLPAMAMAWTPFARESFATGMATFDEFERDAIARASTRAYTALFLAGGLGLGLLAFTTARGWSLPTTYGWIAWGIAWLSIGLTLPALFAEWMVPVPPAGDEWED